MGGISQSPVGESIRPQSVHAAYGAVSVGATDRYSPLKKNL